jgi:tRNA (cmo5U34)-methyltransferase
MESKLNIPENWTFKNDNVCKHFDDHVRESLPWYDMVTGFVLHFARHFIPEKGLVYDIGASTGNIGSAINGVIEARNAEFHAIEQSLQMAALYKGPQKLHICDALEYDYKSYDFCVCFLVIMFFPVHVRKAFVQNLFKKIKPGGALLIVDKVESPGGYLGTALSRLTISQKLVSKIPDKQILQKELSLAGYQRPISEAILGKEFTRFFQAGEFSGWIATKNEN